MASLGLPDLGVSTLGDVVEDVRRITRVTKAPLLVDIDTGFGGALSIARCIRGEWAAGIQGVRQMQPPRTLRADRYPPFR